MPSATPSAAITSARTSVVPNPPPLLPMVSLFLSVHLRRFYTGRNPCRASIRLLTALCISTSADKSLLAEVLAAESGSRRLKRADTCCQKPSLPLNIRLAPAGVLAETPGFRELLALRELDPD